MGVNERVAQAEQIDDIDKLIQEGHNFFGANYINQIDGMELEAPIPFYERAIKLAQESGKSEQEHKARIELGSYLAWIARYDDALPHFVRAVELKPNDFNNMLLLATLYRDIGKFDLASQEFLKAAKNRKGKLLERGYSLTKAIKYHFKAKSH